MIGNITFNNYKNIQNKQNPTFSGKSFVRVKLFDETFLVPKAVANVRRSVKYVFAEDNNNCYMSNAVNLRDKMFLGIAHFYDCLKKVSEITIGKIYKNKKETNCSVNIVKKNIKNKKLDLGIFNIEVPKKGQFAKSTPIKIAEAPPQKGETVYIVGYHSDFKEPKTIPATYKGLSKTSIANNEEYGASAEYLEITSDILKNRVNPTCLSGAAIVNKKGELIGIQGKGMLTYGKSDGTLFGISIDTVKKYFKEVNISI